MNELRVDEVYEAVIGLEVHVQLATRSKIFCRCSTAYGAPPNTHVCPVCLGHPGVLPVLNREAVVMALRFGRAVGARAPEASVFARKNYFYPDLPKGYQITQYEHPILLGGSVPFRLDGTEVRTTLIRAHLEEDAGKSVHAGSALERASLVDLNRAGTPLLEVVTAPDLRSPREARAFVERMRQLVVALGISDGNLEEGSLRADANVSIRRRGGSALGTRVEIKNLNSYRFLEKALDWEIRRQAHLLDDGETPVQETRLWDAKESRTRLMRTKEEAEDYRYFPEPDLPPLVLDAALRDGAAREFPELPWDREARFEADYALKPEDAAVLAGERHLAEYFEATAAAAGDARAAAAWVLTEVLRVVNASPDGWSGLRVGAAALGALVRRAGDGAITGRIAKTVFARMAETGEEPDAILAREGLAQIGNRDRLAGVIDAVLADHPGQVRAWLGGKTTLAQFFIGQVMRRTRGQADPAATADLVQRALEARRGEGGDA